MRWTVRTRIAVDLIAAVSLSMIVVGFATLLAARQLLNNNGAEMTEQLASSLAAQISRMRLSGRSLAHPDNRLILESFLGDEVFARAQRQELAGLQRATGAGGLASSGTPSARSRRPRTLRSAAAGRSCTECMAFEPGREGGAARSARPVSLILGRGPQVGSFLAGRTPCRSAQRRLGPLRACDRGGRAGS